MARQWLLRFGAVMALLFLGIAISPEGTAQAPRRQPTPGDARISPDVSSDHRVTFRINAPKASEVTLRGDWMEAQGPVKLEKGENGAWSVTVGPLVPDFYSYSFNVDGVKTLD